MNNPTPNPSSVWIASVDIGKKNFSFCVEEVSLPLFEEMTNIPIQDRYLSDGTHTIKFHNLMRDIYMNGKIILFENVDLTENCDSTQYLDPRVFINMTNLLDKYRVYWDQCITFVIEQQMGFGKQRNTMALKVGQHCFSYFTFLYAQFKLVIEFPAYQKTRILGAPKKMAKYDRKKWAVKQAIEILLLRDDQEMLEKLNSRKKQDDLCDTLIQAQSFKYLCFVDKSI